MRYAVRMSDAQGRITQAVRSGPSEEAVLRDMSAEGLYVLSLRQAPPGGTGAGRDSRSYSGRSVAEFTESIALLIRAGLSVRDSLEVAESVFPAGAGRRGEAGRLVGELNQRVRAGVPFADAVSEMQHSFPPVYRGLVRIGERVGTLEGVLGRLSDYLSEQKRMHDRIAGAMIYPLLVIGVALVGMVAVSAIVVPKAQELFAQLGTGLPARIRTLAASAKAVVFGTAGILVGVTVAAVAVRALRRRAGPAARSIDTAALHIPWLGKFLGIREMVHVAFALETLSENGVSLEEAFTEASLVCGNQAFRQALAEASFELVRGRSPSQVLLSHSIFPERLGRWVVIGERTGHVERVFGQLRVYYQAEFEKWTGRIMSLIEPALIVAVGIIMLVMILTFVVPLFSLYGSILP